MASENKENEVCQSCGKPMGNPEDYGTNADGQKNNDYCSHCFQNGKFVYPAMTMELMIDVAAGLMMSQAFMEEKEARSKAGLIVPKLKRWAK